MQKILSYFKKHKIFSVIILISLGVGGYFTYQKLKPAEPNRYVLAQIEKGAVATTVSGTGQVVSNNEFEIKSKVSGDVTKVLVKEGQAVSATTTIMQLDSSDAYKAIRDAQSALASSKNSLDKLKKPATTYEIAQAENSLSDAKTTYEKLKLTQQITLQKNQDNIKNANDNIEKAYDDSYNAISQAFLDLPNIISKLYDNLNSNGISTSEPSVGGTQSNVSSLLLTSTSYDKDFIAGLQEQSENDYNKARTSYNNVFNKYKTLSRNSSNEEKEMALEQTLEMVKVVSQASKSQANYFDGWADRRTIHLMPVFSKVKEYQANIDSYITSLNSHVSSLKSVSQSITTNKQNLKNSLDEAFQISQNNPLDLKSAENNIKERELNYQKLKEGADELDIRSQELSIQERYNSLRDAQEKLGDYTIKSPIDGVISKINFKENDTVGGGTAIATIVTQQNIVEITLNEVDVAKVKIGQKATFTFDALSELTLTGQVIEIDTVGTVTQGVVSYAVKLSLDSQDERIKSGMSAGAVIVTDIHLDVYKIVSSAIKSSGQQSYIEAPAVKENINALEATASTGVLLSNELEKKEVTLGLSDDTYSEIINEDIKEGDWVIIKTIIGANNSASNSATSQKSILQMGTGARTNTSGGSRAPGQQAPTR